jgi:hypothetical protein
MPRSLTDEEIDRRLPVWVALSELFLDTKLGPADWDRIAATIRETGFSPAQAQACLDSEVAPVFSQNMLATAGGWAGWSDEFVRQAITSYLRHPPPRRWLARRAARAVRAIYAEDWAQVKRRLTE